MTKSKHIGAAEIVTQALNYLVANEPMLIRFFNLTGLTADTIREAAEDPCFHVFVLDHFLGDEILLTQFTHTTGIRSRDLRSARHRLEGSASTQDQVKSNR
jgi:hypothetical protein